MRRRYAPALYAQRYAQHYAVPISVVFACHLRVWVIPVRPRHTLCARDASPTRTLLRVSASARLPFRPTWKRFQSVVGCCVVGQSVCSGVYVAMLCVTG